MNINPKQTCQAPIFVLYFDQIWWVGKKFNGNPCASLDGFAIKQDLLKFFDRKMLHSGDAQKSTTL